MTVALAKQCALHLYDAVDVAAMSRCAASWRRRRAAVLAWENAEGFSAKRSCSIASDARAAVSEPEVPSERLRSSNMIVRCLQSILEGQPVTELIEAQFK